MTIERPNGRRIDDIVRAARDLDSTWSTAQTWEQAGSFSCNEVETLCDLLRALGMEDLPERIIEWHGLADEAGDAHFVG